MSMFSWLFPARDRAKPGAAKPGVRAEPRSSAAGPSAPPAPASQPGNRKNERMARREQLYKVVRDAMMRSGVLSASYKFKVLSLDAKGDQFLVMVDLARDSARDSSQLAEIEALIAQAAKSRHGIVVTSVYWRTHGHVAAGDPAISLRSADSGPAPLDSKAGAPSPMPPAVDSGTKAPTPVAAIQQTASRYEPIHPDEVAAFKQALAAGVATPAAVAAAAQGASAQAFDGSGRHGPQSYTLLTGFEDTEMADADHRAPVLSATQYGDLR